MILKLIKTVNNVFLTDFRKVNMNNSRLNYFNNTNSWKRQVKVTREKSTVHVTLTHRIINSK